MESSQAEYDQNVLNPRANSPLSTLHYQLTTKYPEKLEELVPKYLDLTPIDPCTGRTTFVYKLRDATKEPTSTEESPKPAELPYIL
ncbi:MAG: hypothetical protein LBC20_12165, partial [Planctomycetaceae bacterium]|nr:hypothetical protein [Planctomycetaceae bacterium]